MFYLLPECTVVPVTLWYSLLDTKNNYLADILISVICTVIKNKKNLFSSFKCTSKEKKCVYIFTYSYLQTHTYAQRNKCIILKCNIIEWQNYTDMKKLLLLHLRCLTVAIHDCEK